MLEYSSNRYGKHRRVDISSVRIGNRLANDMSISELHAELQKIKCPRIVPGMPKPDMIFALGVFQQEQSEAAPCSQQGRQFGTGLTATSAIPPKADVDRGNRHVRFVPKSRHWSSFDFLVVRCHKSTAFHYRFTGFPLRFSQTRTSARRGHKSDGESRQIAFAVSKV